MNRAVATLLLPFVMFGCLDLRSEAELEALVAKHTADAPASEIAELADGTGSRHGDDGGTPQSADDAYEVQSSPDIDGHDDATADFEDGMDIAEPSGDDAGDGTDTADNGELPDALSDGASFDLADADETANSELDSSAVDSSGGDGVATDGGSDGGVVDAAVSSGYSGSGVFVAMPTASSGSAYSVHGGFRLAKTCSAGYCATGGIGQ